MSDKALERVMAACTLVALILFTAACMFLPGVTLSGALAIVGGALVIFAWLIGMWVITR